MKRNVDDELVEELLNDKEFMEAVAELEDYEDYLTEEDLDEDEEVEDDEELEDLDEDEEFEDDEDADDDLYEEFDVYVDKEGNKFIAPANEDLDEATEVVVRAGKKIRRKRRKAGYKVAGNKYIKMTSQEKRTRKKAGKKASRKARSKKAGAVRKRVRSLRKRGNA